MHRSIKLTMVAMLAALSSAVATTTPASAASGELVRRVYQAGSNTSSIAFNPVVDSKGRRAFGEAWAKANCTNSTVTLYVNPYFNSLGYDRGDLRMIQVWMTPSRTWHMYQASTSYWPLSGTQQSGPSRGFTTFYGGSKTAFSLNFNRTVRVDKTSTYFRMGSTFIAGSDYDEPYCGVDVHPRWYRG